LLYHYFPSKIDLFKAAVAEKAAELASVIEPSHEGSPSEQLADSLDAYLRWIEDNAQTWAKLMQSAATLEEARELVEAFRERTLELVLEELSEGGKVRPALRTAVRGWLGFMDAAILDWAQTRDMPRTRLRDLLLAVFAGAIRTCWTVSSNSISTGCFAIWCSWRAIVSSRKIFSRKPGFGCWSVAISTTASTNSAPGSMPWQEI